MHSSTRTILTYISFILFNTLGVTTTGTAADKSFATKPLATVNGKSIPQSAFDTLYAEQQAQGQPGSEDLRHAIREELIRRELIIQEAKKSGLDKNTAIASQMELARQAPLIRAFIQDYIQKNPTSEEQLKNEYAQLKTKLSGTEYKSRHILLETEEEAQAIITRLKQGEKFEELATQSKDSGTKNTGGDLGWNVASAYLPNFAEALTKLGKNSFTEKPIKTDFGWHVIGLEDTRPVEAPPFDQVKQQLMQRANLHTVEKMLTDLRTKARIQ